MTPKNIVFLLLTLLLNIPLRAQNQIATEHHGHSHYIEHDSVAAHKLIFPSKTPDRVIANLTTDP
ncbi:MAG: metallophosphoesterase, partial [Maribacter sp.]|nr:metallophosphoesterase [Maribacter sp.]